ncbi:hypothetical protein [Nocardioides alkalitolerans]|uniref:hypothetical protein n=1 Tax=Nocardioides alkalitolerans TaxID=281714 RepID=UPI0012FC9D6C|nr:hypothetical protein [Nocardioides alkalitolerans]
MLYDVQPGRMDDAVRAFQETFASFRPAGFTVLFAAADVAHHRLIWVHRYERGFDLGERFYLGKYPDLVHCLWAGTRYDAVAASADLPARPRASAPPPPPRTLAELADGPTVELKVYEVKQGHWVPFLEYWRRIVTLRRAAGFKVEFAVADIPGHRFVWGVSVDGDFTGQNETYLDGEDRRAANVISDHIGRFEIPKVVYLPVS